METIAPQFRKLRQNFSGDLKLLIYKPKKTSVLINELLRNVSYFRFSSNLIKTVWFTNWSNVVYSVQCKCWITHIMADVYLRFSPCGSC